MLACAGGSAAPGPAAEVVVGYASPAALAAALARHPAAVVRTLGPLRVAQLVPRGDAAAFARALRAAPGIRYVETASPRTSTGEPGLAASPGGIPYKWECAAAHENAVPQSVLRAAAQITIAVVDTGADLTAPDIAAKAPVTYNVLTDGGDVADRTGHGTFVAALAAGSVANGEGIAGFGGDARLMIVQASDDGSFTDVDEAAAIVWAVDHGARIVNLSLGGSTTSQTEQAAVDYATAHGALLVAAAGNEQGSGNPVEYPAALLQPVGSNGVGGTGLAVGASTPAGTRAPFSESGSFLSLVAPGVGVVGAVSSTSPPSAYPRFAIPGTRSGLYGVGSGTSFAAPEVAGAAALVWAADPALSAQDVAQILKDTASNHGVWNADTGFGVVDAAAAVARASGAPAAAATVQLNGRRLGRRVQLAWTGTGAVGYRLAVAEDGGPQRTLRLGASTTASYPLQAGHAYVFTVAAVDASGAALATSAPYRTTVAPAAYPSTRSMRAPSARSRSSIRS